MRLSIIDWALELVEVTAKRSTCCRRSVGCVLLDDRGHILATGYNGVPAGYPHCSEGHKCPGSDLPSGQGLDSCFAIHAEQNALLQCPDVKLIRGCVVSCAPCVTCTKLLLNTGCRCIVFREDYPHSEVAATLWKQAGRMWVHQKDGADLPSPVKQP